MDPTALAGAEQRHGARPTEAEESHELAHDELGFAPLELGSYQLGEGTRQLSATRVGRAVHVTDRPLGGPGNTYLVETEVTSVSELEALAEDYRRQAEALGDCPMRASAIDPTQSSRERGSVS